MYLLVDLPMHLRNFKISNQPKRRTRRVVLPMGVVQLHQNYLVVNQVRPVVIINSLILLI